MFGGGDGSGRSSGSDSSSGGGGRVGGREIQNPVGASSSSYTPTHPHHMNMNMLLPPAPFQQQQLLMPTASIGVAVSSGHNDNDNIPKRDERAVQWGIQETRDFIAIQAELEGEFTMSKRNKAFWGVVAAKMEDLGYRRTPDQCKYKWKSLVNRYKGKETPNLDDANQVPFFDELHAVFTATRNHKQQSQMVSKASFMQSSKGPMKASKDESTEEILENDEDDNVDSDEDRVSKSSMSKKKKIEKEKQPQMAASGKSQRQPSNANVRNTRSTLASIPKMLQNFFLQQQTIEMEWRESMEKCAQERELFEHEWRQTMERLERERMMMDQAWRERQEQRRFREESRAEKRDALLTTLLNKLLQEKHS